MKKNKDTVVLEVKADGFQGAKPPRTLSTKRCQAEGPLYVFTETTNCSVQPPPPLPSKSNVIREKKKESDKD